MGWAGVIVVSIWSRRAQVREAVSPVGVHPSWEAVQSGLFLQTMLSMRSASLVPKLAALPGWSALPGKDICATGTVVTVTVVVAGGVPVILKILMPPLPAGAVGQAFVSA